MSEKRITIGNKTKVIVGFSRPGRNGCDHFAIHLHDCANAVVIHPEQKRIVIQQGEGPLRLRNFTVGCTRLLGFDAHPVWLGHSCLVDLDEDHAGQTKHKSTKKKFFVPMAIVMQLETAGDWGWPIELGTTATPLLLPQLKRLEAPPGYEKIVGHIPRTAGECAELSGEAMRWARRASAWIARITDSDPEVMKVRRALLAKLKGLSRLSKQGDQNALACFKLILSVVISRIWDELEEDPDWAGAREIVLGARPNPVKLALQVAESISKKEEA